MIFLEASAKNRVNSTWTKHSSRIFIRMLPTYHVDFIGYILLSMYLIIPHFAPPTDKLQFILTLLLEKENKYPKRKKEEDFLLSVMRALMLY